ncbi:hypothetical protein ILYODFUR_019668 [Ilyodon furcidens]|uniref:Uncharacterized protein n=1 Tax=Ilyodon furcidens TaxID=33524 RepID=A0ABV0U6S3_9TELE
MFSLSSLNIIREIMQCSIKACVMAGHRTISMCLSLCVGTSIWRTQTHTSISSYTRCMNRVLRGTSACERDSRNRRRLGEDQTRAAYSFKEECGNVDARVFLRDVGTAEKSQGNNPIQTSPGMNAKEPNLYFSHVLIIAEYIWCTLFIKQKAWKEWK